MDQKEVPPNPPPSYTSVQSSGQEYSTKDGFGDQGYNYPQGYTSIPTQPQYAGYPPSGQGNMPQPQNPPYPIQQTMPQTHQPPAQANYVIVNQPQQVGMTVGMATGEPKPPNYLCLSIIVCLCCNCPCGIIALAFACQSDSAHAAGNIEAARKNGRRALTFSLLGIIVFIIMSIIFAFKYWNQISFSF